MQIPLPRRTAELQGKLQRKNCGEQPNVGRAIVGKSAWHAKQTAHHVCNGRSRGAATRSGVIGVIVALRNTRPGNRGRTVSASKKHGMNSSVRAVSVRFDQD